MEQSLIPEVMPPKPNGSWPKDTWFQNKLNQVRWDKLREQSKKEFEDEADELSPPQSSTSKGS